MVFARYVAVLVPLDDRGVRTAAAAGILLLSAINYVGVRSGTLVQTALTVIKLAAIGVLLVVLFGAAHAPRRHGGGRDRDRRLRSRDRRRPVRLRRLAHGDVCRRGDARSGAHDSARVDDRHGDRRRDLPRAERGVSARAAARPRARVDARRRRRDGGRGWQPRCRRDRGPRRRLVVRRAERHRPRRPARVPRDGRRRTAASSGWRACTRGFRRRSAAIVAQAIWSAGLAYTGTYRALFTRVVYTEWIFFGALALGAMRMRRRRRISPAFRAWGFPGHARAVRRSVRGRRHRPGGGRAARERDRPRYRGRRVARLFSCGEATACRVVDFHNHFYPPRYIDALKSGESSVKVTIDADGNPCCTIRATTTSPCAAIATSRIGRRCSTSTASTRRSSRSRRRARTSSRARRAIRLARIVNDEFARRWRRAAATSPRSRRCRSTIRRRR